MLPVCSMVERIRSRSISSAHEAARWVSLFPLEYRDEKVAKRYVDEWKSIHDFLDRGKGTAVEHSLLLCGLLLGFGLKAYICLGAGLDGSHAWVITCDDSELDDEEKRPSEIAISSWKFWESLTGRVYHKHDPRINYFYRTVGCIFNDREFYANV